MDLNGWANVAEIFGTVTIVAGLAFGAVQLSEFRRQRLDAVAGELMRSFYDADFGAAIARLQRVDDGLTRDQLTTLGPEYLEAAIKSCLTFETFGLLVYRRIAPFDLTVELCGGLVQVHWRKLERYVMTTREDENHASFAEWFQWLAEVSARYKSNALPAYQRGKDWKP